ncbi:MAG: hypothetical protein N2490_07230 [Ignavibacteria bacterium]|nr:hypothetical protein [Ignavibacteria bacterium]
MFNRRLIILIFFVFIGSSFSQVIKYDSTIDVRTYDLYMKNKYDEMLTIADSAFEIGIDFYYLRMRVGIAYYEKKNYMSSIPHFERALDFNKSDTIAMEYLYYSYLFSGLYKDASILAKNSPPKLKEKINYKKAAFINGIYTEGGYIYNGDYEESKNKKITSNQQISGEQKLFKNGIYFNIDLIHNIGEQVTLLHGYIYNAFNFLKRYELQNNLFKTFDARTLQNEYYISAGVHIGKGFDLVSAFHYLNVNVEDIINNQNNNFTKVSKTLNDYVLAIELNKRIHHFDIGLSSGVSRLNDANQLQNSFTMTWYPFGNLNFYLVNSFILHLDKGEKKEDYSTNFLYYAKVGFKVTDILWVESNYTTGNIYNYHENSAFIVYNNVDKIKYKYEIVFLLPLSIDFYLSLRYQFYPQEMYSFKYISNTQTEQTIENIFNHKLIGGIKWTF